MAAHSFDGSHESVSLGASFSGHFPTLTCTAYCKTNDLAKLTRGLPGEAVYLRLDQWISMLFDHWIWSCRRQNSGFSLSEIACSRGQNPLTSSPGVLTVAMQACDAS